MRQRLAWVTVAGDSDATVAANRQASRTYADVFTNPTLAETFRANWDAQDTDDTFRTVEEDRAIATAGGGSRLP